MPAKAGVQFSFSVALRSQADTKLFQANPTLAAGDVLVSIDGGATANIANLPVVIGAGALARVTLTSAEMTATEDTTVLFADVAGAQWCSLCVVVPVSTRNIDDLAWPTTSGRSVDVTATGAAGVDWANVEAPTTVVGLTGTTVGTATALGAGAVNAAAVADNAIDAAAIADGAIDAATFAAGAINAAAIATDAIGAAELADSAVAEIWTYATRTLTQAAATLASALAGSTITIARGDSLTATITGLSSSALHSKVWFTVKRSLSDADSAAIIQIEHTGGLLYLNGAVVPAARNANGTLSLPSETSVTVTLDEVETDDLVPANGLYWDIQMLDTNGVVTTLAVGDCNIAGDVTRSVA